MDTGDSLVDAQPLDVANLLKQFLRELPEPLLTSSLHGVFVSCYQNGSPVNDAVLLSCLLLPSYNLATLRYVALFLARVAAASESNRMNAANLAVCLAPNLLYSDAVSTPRLSNVITENSLLAAETAVIRTIVEKAADIGMVSESLVQRATLLGTCYLSDVDDQNMNSSAATVGVTRKKSLKRKKKKRSGSLQG